MQRPHAHKVILLLLTLLLVAGCKPTVPSDYIQPDDMEDILYDYHLAVSMAQDKNASDVQRKAWQLAVLKKHGVNETEFNRSMLYYMRHTERMHDIYEKLSERFGDEARALGASDAELGQYGSIASRGDTADVWAGRRTLMLNTYAPYNKYSFELKVDTAYHKGDRLVLSFDSQFILQEGVRNVMAGLIVTFGNDSTTQQVQQISSDMRQSLSVEDRDSLGIKSVRGFFLLGRNIDSPTTTLTLFFAENIKLVRIHAQKRQPREGDSNPMNPNTPIRNVGGSPAPDHRVEGAPASPPTTPQQPASPAHATPPQPIERMRPANPAEQPIRSLNTP